MLTGLIPLLRGLVGPLLGQLKQGGLDALKAALRKALQDQGDRIQRDALARLTKDGVVAKLGQAGPFTDQDNVSMNGNQFFVHECLFAIPRAVGGGTPSDVVRDDHFAAWGLTEADTLLAGVTDGAEAVKRVFERLRQQFR